MLMILIYKCLEVSEARQGQVQSIGGDKSEGSSPSAKTGKYDACARAADAPKTSFRRRPTKEHMAGLYSHMPEHLKPGTLHLYCYNLID